MTTESSQVQVLQQDLDLGAEQAHEDLVAAHLQGEEHAAQVVLHRGAAGAAPPRPARRR